LSETRHWPDNKVARAIYDKDRNSIKGGVPVRIVPDSYFLR
jgi:hypothetical protein